MSGRRPSERELLYCHQCQDEWFRTDEGLKCPTCQSEIVEIIQPDTDPRADYASHDDDLHDDHHPFHDHHPWGGDAPDPDEGDVSHVEWTGPGGTRFTRTTMRSTTPGGGRMPGMPPGMPDPFGSMFGSLMGGVPPPGRTSGPPGNEGTGNATRSTIGGSPRIGTAYTFSMNGPGQVRWTRSGGTGNVGMEDLHGIMGNIFNMFAPPAGMGHAGGPGGQAGGNRQNMPPFNPMMRMLMELVPPTTGASGDVAYTQEGYDRIMTMLREQGEVAGNAPGPASAAAIDALPKIKITKEHLDDEGKADCSICMETVNPGTEVTQLPCKHWFHGECVQSWLKEHDTCPQCRRGITPSEGDQDTPRTTGQTPRYWEHNPSDLDTIARGVRGGNRPRRGNDRGPPTYDQQPQSRQAPRAPNSPTASTSSRSSGRGSLSGVTGFISGLGRRFGGSGNDGGGGSGSRH